MGERITHYCDGCEKTIKKGEGFRVIGGIVLAGTVNARNLIDEGDYCPTCFVQELGIALPKIAPSDVFDEIMGGLDKMFTSEKIEPSDEMKQKIKDLGAKTAANWEELCGDFQAQMKKFFQIDEEDDSKDGSNNGSTG